MTYREPAEREELEVERLRREKVVDQQIIKTLQRRCDEEMTVMRVAAILAVGMLGANLVHVVVHAVLGISVCSP